MTIRGRVQNGVVVLSDSSALPEGTEVEVSPVSNGQSWGDVFKDLIGAADGLPEDLAENHDQYIHGRPKR